MPTQFTPVTTVSPMAVNDGSKLDEAIGLVQGLIKQRQDAADRQYQGQVRSRQLQGFAEEDAQKAQAASQNQRFLGLMDSPTKDFDTKSLNDMIYRGELTPDQGKALSIYATDYVSDQDRGVAFARGLTQDVASDPIKIATLMRDTGVDETTARFYLGQLDNKGGDAGGGTGGNNPPPDGKPNGGKGDKDYPLVGQSKAVNTKKMLKEKGMPFGDYNVYIHGSDASPNARLRANGKVYIKDSSGFYVVKNGERKKIKPEKLDKSIKDSLNQGYSAFYNAHIEAQGYNSTAIETDYDKYKVEDE